MSMEPSNSLSTKDPPTTKLCDIGQADSGENNDESWIHMIWTPIKSAWLNTRFGQGTIDFWTLNVLYLFILSLVGGVLIYLIEKNAVSFLNCWFLATSAVTSSGLTPIELSRFNSVSVGLCYLLMSFGSTIFLSLPPVLIRRYLYRLQASDLRAISKDHGKDFDPNKSIVWNTIKRTEPSMMSRLDIPRFVESITSLNESTSAENKIQSRDDYDLDFILPEAAGLLVKIYILYVLCIQFLGILSFGIYAICSQELATVLSELSINPWAWAVFHTSSSFYNVGFSILPASLTALKFENFVLSLTCILLVLGNSLFPVALRIIVVILNYMATKGFLPMSSRKPARFLFNNPRRASIHLFQRRETWYLFMTWLFTIVIQTSSQLIFDISHFGDLTTLKKIGVSVLQSVYNRTGGFYVFPMDELSSPTLLLFLGFMLADSYPILIIMRKTGAIGQAEEDAKNILKQKKLPVLRPRSGHSGHLPTGNKKRLSLLSQASLHENHIPIVADHHRSNFTSARSYSTENYSGKRGSLSRPRHFSAISPDAHSVTQKPPPDSQSQSIRTESVLRVEGSNSPSSPVSSHSKTQSTSPNSNDGSDNSIGHLHSMAVFRASLEPKKSSDHRPSCRSLSGSLQIGTQGDALTLNAIEHQSGLSSWFVQDIVWVYAAMLLISITRVTKSYSESRLGFDLFSLFFNCISTYSTVGLTVGNSFGDINELNHINGVSTIVLVILMVFGRSRSIPATIDYSFATDNTSESKTENNDKAKHALKLPDKFKKTVSPSLSDSSGTKQVFPGLSKDSDPNAPTGKNSENRTNPIDDSSENPPFQFTLSPSSIPAKFTVSQHTPVSDLGNKGETLAAVSLTSSPPIYVPLSSSTPKSRARSKSQHSPTNKVQFEDKITPRFIIPLGVKLSTCSGSDAPGIPKQNGHVTNDHGSDQPGTEPEQNRDSVPALKYITSMELQHRSSSLPIP